MHARSRFLLHVQSLSSDDDGLSQTGSDILNDDDDDLSDEDLSQSYSEDDDDF